MSSISMRQTQVIQDHSQYRYIMHLLVYVKSVSKGNFWTRTVYRFNVFDFEPGNPNIHCNLLSSKFAPLFFCIPKHKLNEYFDDFCIYSGGSQLGCVAVTDTKSWKLFDCRKRAPFICELKPAKPKKRKNLSRPCSLRRPNN